MEPGVEHDVPHRHEAEELGGVGEEEQWWLAKYELRQNSARIRVQDTNDQQRQGICFVERLFS